MRSEPVKGYENRLLIVLTLTFGVVFLDRSSLNILAPYIQKDFKLSDTQIGALASALSIAWAVSGVVVSHLTDVFGRERLVLAVSVVIFSLCSVLSGVAASFVALLSARLLMGLAEGPVLPISQMLMAVASSPARRGLNMGILQQLGSNILGAVLAPVALVFVAERYNWHSAFFIAGLPGLLCAALVWRTVRHTDRRMKVALPAAVLSEERPMRLLAAFSYRNVWLCACVAALMLAQITIAFVFLPLYLVRVDSFTTSQMAFLMSTLGASAVLAGVAVPALSDRYGRKPVVLGVLLLALAVPVGVSMSAGSLVPTAACLFLGFLNSGAGALVMATIPSETLPPGHVATVIGAIIGMAEIFAALAGPLLGGVVSDHVGLGRVMWLQAGYLTVSIGFACFIVETAPCKRHRPAPL